MPTQTEQKSPTARSNEQEQSSPQRKDASSSSSRTGLMQRRGESSFGIMPYDLFRMNPFSLLRRMTDEMDRMVQEAGMERAGISSGWSPAIDVSLRDGMYNVHAELPGLEPEDVKIEVENDALVIEGERKYEHEEKQGGMQRTERQYGFFRRSIPLPESAKTEQAKAKFHNGVLEIAIPVPEQQSNRRSIPIEAESASSKPPQSQAA